MSALALIVAATLAQAGTLRSDLALRGGGAGRGLTGNVDFTSQPTSATCAAPTSLAMTRPAGSATFARSDTSPACCPESDAACCAVAIDQPCVHSSAYAGSLGGAGAEVFGAGANALTNSEAFDSWTLANSAGKAPVVTPNAAAAPDGTATAEQVDYPAISSTQYSSLLKPFTGTAAPWDPTVWVKRASGTSTIYLCTWNGATTHTQSCTVTSAWTRCAYSTPPTLTAATWNLEIGVDKGCTGVADQGAQTVFLWGAQATPTAQPAAYRSTTTTAYAGSVSTATSLTLPATATNKDKWAISIKATPAGAGWARTNTIGLWQWGGTYGTANSVSAYTDVSSKVVFEVYDGTGGWQRWTSTDALTGAVQRSIAVGFNAGTYRVLVDGSEVSGSTSGAGTGLLAALPTATLTLGIVGSSVLSGTVACVRQGVDLAAVKGCM